jgi:GNAT superfamily N-acetyltransferase
VFWDRARGGDRGLPARLPTRRRSFPDDAIRADWFSALTDPGGETYIAFEDDEAVGVVSVGHGVVQTLYVMPEFWSRGIGSVLHDHALDRLREVNVQEARLWTLTDNHRARAVYEKRGWSPHRPDARRAVSAPSDRRRVCPLDTSQLA